jgi:hypothetical protein
MNKKTLRIITVTGTVIYFLLLCLILLIGYNNVEARPMLLRLFRGLICFGPVLGILYAVIRGEFVIPITVVYVALIIFGIWFLFFSPLSGIAEVIL